MGKGNKKRRHKAQRKAAQAPLRQMVGAGAQTAPEPPTTTSEALRPTEQRMARGNWRIPMGMGKHEKPVVDTSADPIGALHDVGLITSSQEQAARQWQALRMRYIQELPDVEGFKSCIAGSVPGFDDGDGDAKVIADYRRIERRLSRVQRIEVIWVCEDRRLPISRVRLDVLRSALDAIGGA